MRTTFGRECATEYTMGQDDEMQCRAGSRSMGVEDDCAWIDMGGLWI